MELEYRLLPCSPAGLNRNSRLSTSFRFQAYRTRQLGMLLGNKLYKPSNAVKKRKRRKKEILNQILKQDKRKRSHNGDIATDT
jgi:hypothetical protein